MMTNERQCSKCPSSFDLIPPADPQYNIPRDKIEHDENIPRTYECKEKKHPNTIYWHKDKPVFVESHYSTTDDYEKIRNFP